nr:MAG TPA: hypothetical protein [Caudoviricetes sp.]
MNPYYKKLAQPVSIVLPRYGTGGGAGGFVSKSQEKLLQRINIKSSTTASREEKNDRN